MPGIVNNHVPGVTNHVPGVVRLQDMEKFSIQPAVVPPNPRKRTASDIVRPPPHPLAMMTSSVQFFISEAYGREAAV